MNKKALEFSFAWLFAILVGAFIIFLAIYAVMGALRTSQYSGYTQLAREISIIFNPLETGLASGKATSARINIETRIYNRCLPSGSFGNQKFSLSQKSGFLKAWPEAGGEITLYHKYVFSSEIEEGKEFFFFSKPFEMPFKASEIIFLSAKSYCFIDAPEFIKDEAANLKLKNVKLENCTSSDKKVCFGSSAAECEISVFGLCVGVECKNEYDIGYTKKQGKNLYFAGSLIYASIFSDNSIYECNFKRLMMRIQQISYLYREEMNFLASRGCGNVMTGNLLSLEAAAQTASNSTSSASILMLKEAAKALDEQNSAQGGCKIYEN